MSKKMKWELSEKKRILVTKQFAIHFILQTIRHSEELIQEIKK